jgi:hypothetical protein
MQYQVGQFLFIVFKDKQSLVPVRVVEEVVRRTVDGEKRSYLVSVSENRNLEPVPLDESPENVFTSLEDAKDALLENARRGIERVCARALSVKAREFRELPQQESPQASRLERSFEESDDEGVQEDETILLENGVRAKVKLPPALR